MMIKVLQPLEEAAEKNLHALDIKDSLRCLERASVMVHVGRQLALFRQNLGAKAQESTTKALYLAHR